MAWRYQRAAVRTCPRAAATAADIKLVITFRSRGVLAALAVVPRGLFGLVQQAGLEQPPQATEHDDGRLVQRLLFPVSVTDVAVRASNVAIHHSEFVHDQRPLVFSAASRRG